jgi:hypothetical protein
MVVLATGLAGCRTPAAVSASSPLANAQAAAPVVVEQAAPTRLRLNADSTKTMGGYRVVLTASEDGTLVDRQEVVVSADAVRADMLSHLSPDRADATFRAIDEELQQRLAPIFEAQRDLERRLIVTYPSCDDIPEGERRATFSFSSRAGSGDSEESVKHCVVVPPGGAPEANAIMALWLEMTKAAKAFEADIPNRYDFVEVALLWSDRAPTRNGKVIRPYYAGIVRKATGSFEGIGDFIQRVTAGRDSREVVEAAASLVQSAETEPSDSLGTSFRSPGSVLVEGRGQLDAKAAAIAALIRTALPRSRILLMELNDAFLLGVAVPPRKGDVVMEDLARGPGNNLVVLDPSAPVPLGRVVQPGLRKVVPGGRVTVFDARMLYDLSGGRQSDGRD